MWLGGAATRTTLAAAGTSVLLTQLNAAALALRPFTVVRSRGLLFGRSDQFVATEPYGFAYGNIIVTEQAVAAGVVSVPTPVTEDPSDWHVYERIVGTLILGSGVGFQDMSGGENLIIDSKAMRKVDLGEDLIAVIESDALSNGVIVSAYIRVLIKLH